MESSNRGNAESFDAALIIHESLFERLKFVQQISAVCQEFNLICCPGNLADLMACCRRFHFCVLIVESAVLLKATPVQVGELLRRGSSLRVLARVDREEAAQLKDLIMLGCFGFLTDDTNLTSLKKILEAIGCGEMWVPRGLLSQTFQAELVEHNFSRLSRRECEILSLLGQGLTNKTIAERLFISQETLRWHLRNLYGKTRVQGRDKLIRYANDLNDVALVSADKASTTANKQINKARRCS